ncbi:HRDC domain-containing protein, partial [Tamlana crocina]
IETYGVVKLTKKGEKFLQQPGSFMMTEDHIYEVGGSDSIVSAGRSGGTDENLVKILKELRKNVAKKRGLAPYLVFQDPSLEDMALKYPVTIEELGNIHGVGEGKAKK